MRQKYVIHGKMGTQVLEVQMCLAKNHGLHRDDKDMLLLAEGVHDSWAAAEAWKDSLDLPRLLKMRLLEKT